MVRRTSEKGIDDIKDPRWLFGLLIGVTIVLALVLGLIVDRSVSDQNDKIEWWKIIISGASLSVSLFLGSIVAIHAYRYVNRLSHNWKIRHDYAVDRLDRLYGPLWDETKCIIKALQSYYRSGCYNQGRGYDPGIPSVQKEISHIQRYEQLANSHLQLFLTKKVMEDLQGFHESVFKYDALRDEIRNSMAIEFRKTLMGHELLMGSAEVKKENIASTLWSEISQDSNLGNILNLQPNTRLDLRMKARFIEHLTANASVPNDKGNVIYDSAIDHLRENMQLEELRLSRNDCLKKGESLLAVLKGIIEKPESALE